MPLSLVLTFPQNRLNLCVPVENMDEDCGDGSDRRLAGVLPAVLQLDVIHTGGDRHGMRYCYTTSSPEGGHVPACGIPLQVWHRRRLAAVKLQDLGKVYWIKI